MVARERPSDKQEVAGTAAGRSHKKPKAEAAIIPRRDEKQERQRRKRGAKASQAGSHTAKTTWQMEWLLLQAGQTAQEKRQLCAQVSWGGLQSGRGQRPEQGEEGLVENTKSWKTGKGQIRSSRSLQEIQQRVIPFCYYNCKVSF